MTHLKVGDWIAARTSGFVPAGTRGIIEAILHAELDMYYVQFGGYNEQKLMHARDLEHADAAPAREYHYSDFLPCPMAAAYLVTAC
jgi:hypothetical protein